MLLHLLHLCESCKVPETQTGSRCQDEINTLYPRLNYVQPQLSIADMGAKISLQVQEYGALKKNERGNLRSLESSKLAVLCYDSEKFGSGTMAAGLLKLLLW